jgi:hypothetical protein
VALVSRYQATLEEVKAAILQEVQDVKDYEQAEAAVNATVRRFGRLDILIANAGACSPSTSSNHSLYTKTPIVRTNSNYFGQKLEIKILSHGGRPSRSMSKVYSILYGMCAFTKFCCTLMYWAVFQTHLGTSCQESRLRRGCYFRWCTPGPSEV